MIKNIKELDDGVLSEIKGAPVYYMGAFNERKVKKFCDYINKFKRNAELDFVCVDDEDFIVYTRNTKEVQSLFVAGKRNFKRFNDNFSSVLKKERGTYVIDAKGNVVSAGVVPVLKVHFFDEDEAQRNEIFIHEKAKSVLAKTTYSTSVMVDNNDCYLMLFVPNTSSSNMELDVRAKKKRLMKAFIENDKAGYNCIPLDDWGRVIKYENYGKTSRESEREMNF